MDFKGSYKVLKQQRFISGDYSIVPIRMEDRFKIMQWRNEQMYHLRQASLLTREDQDSYFKNVISGLFEQERPGQILFSYVIGDDCIGYGGLVHINWMDKNAEISFIMKTSLEQHEFKKHWNTYLDLLEQVAFEELGLHKLFTYAFDIRPQLYKVLESNAYVQEAVLKEHCYYERKFIDVIIHSKINLSIKVRQMVISDEGLMFEWANDPIARKNSFNPNPILFEDHRKWFASKINDENACYMICEIENVPAGLVRFDFDANQKAYIIGITIDKDFRGKGLAVAFLRRCCKCLIGMWDTPIIAYIKEENMVSRKAFEKADFSLLSKIEINEVPSLKYLYGK